MEHLIGVAHTRLEEAKGELERAFRNQGVHVQVLVPADAPDKQDWWSWQIIEAAKKQAYYADLNRWWDPNRRFSVSDAWLSTPVDRPSPHDT